MPAYVIIDISIIDPEIYEEYEALAPAGIAAYGGKYLAHDGKIEVFEGDWQPGRLVILEFDSAEKARQWIVSPEYEPARKLCHQSATTQIVMIEGL